MSDPPPRVPLVRLALAFNHIALASFGGGLSAWSREVLVVEKGWIAEKEFLSAMTMCRILPGANQVNLAVFAGTKLRGWMGAVAAIFGLVCVPVTLMLVAAYFYFGFKELPAVDGALHGASSAAVALTFTMVIKTGRVCLTGVVPVALFALAFVLSGVVRLPLIAVLGIVAPLGLLWAWPRGPRAAASGSSEDSGDPAT